VAKPYKGYPSQYAYRKARGDKSASGTPGATRARRAKGLEPTPARRGQWSQPTPGGTRDLKTRGDKRALQAARQVIRKGTDLNVGIKGQYSGMGPTPREKPGDISWTGRISAEEFASALDANDGDIRATMTSLLELRGTAVERIDEFIIKDLPRKG